MPWLYESAAICWKIKVCAFLFSCWPRRCACNCYQYAYIYVTWTQPHPQTTTTAGNWLKTCHNKHATHFSRVNRDCQLWRRYCCCCPSPPTPPPLHSPEKWQSWKASSAQRIERCQVKWTVRKMRLYKSQRVAAICHFVAHKTSFLFLAGKVVLAAFPPTLAKHPWPKVNQLTGLRRRLASHMPHITAASPVSWPARNLPLASGCWAKHFPSAC